jgi:hypothetical protein
MLVPEAVGVDEETLDKLCKATEEDLFLSDISPLGVKFNTLRGNTKDLEKEEDVKKGKYGKVCTKFYASSNKDYSERAICTASRTYQTAKINDLKSMDLSKDQYEAEFNKVVDKGCICVGLGTSTLKFNNIERKSEGESVSVCPGPNTAYFSRRIGLTEMIDHIYGRTNVIDRDDRPNFFIKELSLYIDYFKDMIEDVKINVTNKQKKSFSTFGKNLQDGIAYYNNLFSDLQTAFTENKELILNDLKSYEEKLSLMIRNVDKLEIVK